MFETEECVASVLKRNGFRVIRYFRCPLGWIDVAGFRRGFSIGVEVGNPEFVESKLLGYPFNAKVVIGKGESDKVIVVESLEEFCRRFGFECLEGKKEDGFYDRALEYLERCFGDPVVARRALDGLIFLYMSGEVVEDYSGRVRDRIPFVKLFPTLVDAGLATRDTREMTKPQTYMTSLTRTGVRLAKLALKRKMEECRDEIERLVGDVGGWVVRIATIGLMDRRGLRLEKRNVDAVSDLSGSFEELFYSISPVLSKVPIYELFKLVRGCDSTVCAFFRVLCYTVLYPRVEELFERLFSIGLASKLPVYDYYGEFFGYEYRTSKEIASYLSKISYVDVEGVEKFESVLRAIALRPSEDLRIAIEKGIVREVRGGYEIVDEGKFEGFIKARISKVIAEFLSSISSSRAP